MTYPLYTFYIFCKNIGEAIRPTGAAGSCGLTSLPARHDYPAATVPCLREIAERSHGEDPNGKMVKVTDTLYRSQRTRLSEDCGNGCKCIQLQFLSKKKPPGYEKEPPEYETVVDTSCWYHRVILHAVEGMVTCCIC
jgi:hypothetical protein